MFDYRLRAGRLYGCLYAGRANLSPVLYAGLQPGGQLTTTTDMKTFRVIEGDRRAELMEDLRKRANVLAPICAMGWLRLPTEQGSL